jgi:hypothetical protein
MTANCGLDFSDSLSLFSRCQGHQKQGRYHRYQGPIQCRQNLQGNGVSAVEYSRVCYYAVGKRERLTFSSLEGAKIEARLKANLLSRGDSAALQLEVARVAEPRTPVFK